jgi:hypothetical protein
LAAVGVIFFGAAVSTPQEIFALRHLYYENQYRPVPITNGLKFPTDKAWPDLARQDPPYVCQFMPDHRALGTGILCDGLRPLDIDIDDPALVGEVVDYALDHFGGAPTRYRNNGPRVLMLYAAAEGTPSKAYVKNRDTRAGVEILGKGNQFFSHGRHPSGATLEWHNGPERTPRAQLNTIDEAGVTEVLDFCAELVAANSGSIPGLRPRANTRSTPRAVSFGSGSGEWHTPDIVDALDHIPNTGADWDFWFRIGAAVFVASGGSQQGFKAWTNWSRQSAAYDKNFTERTWAGLNNTPTSNITPGTLIWHVRQFHPSWVKPSHRFSQSKR